MDNAAEIDFEAARKARDELDLREDIFLIESPSSDDLYVSRNEGDALARTLYLADINVHYYLATNEETFDRAIDDIVIRINSSKRDRADWPFIHISAHGLEDGLELTDGSVLYWEQLTRRMFYAHELVGCVALPPQLPQDLPRLNLSLSSCSAFVNYKKNIEKPYPFQMMLGPTTDVGWCQSLIGYTTFFYKAFIQKNDFRTAIEGMNAAAGKASEKIFDACWSHDIDKMARDIGAMIFPRSGQ